LLAVLASLLAQAPLRVGEEAAQCLLYSKLSLVLLQRVSRPEAFRRRSNVARASPNQRARCAPSPL
jgi:hypothetical protein